MGNTFCTIKSPLAQKGMITCLTKMDNKYILGALTTGAVFIVDIHTNTLLYSITNHSKEVTCIDGVKDKSDDAY